MSDENMKRKYRLSDEGRQALQTAIQENQPWRRSTGPRSAEGKMRVARNALVHGTFSIPILELRREISETLRMCRQAGAQESAPLRDFAAHGLQ